MKQIIFLFGFLLFLAGCENKPKPTATRNIQDNGYTEVFTSDSLTLESENLGAGCTTYPYFDGKHRLSILVEPQDLPEDGLITWFIFGTNPKTSAYFLLSAVEVDVSGVQSFEIPVCPDPGGWTLNFRTTLGGFWGNVSYCTYGFNRGKKTAFSNESQKDLLIDRYSPYANGSNSCTEPTGYITQPWCTGEIEITGTKHQSNAILYFFENYVAWCDAQQPIVTTINWELPRSTPTGTFSYEAKTYPLPKKGIPNLDRSEIYHFMLRSSVAGLDAEIDYSVNGTHVYSDTFPSNKVSFNTTMHSTTTPCVFQK